MAFREVESIRGISKPMVPDLRSRMALGFGKDPSVLMATCEKPDKKTSREPARSKNNFISLYLDDSRKWEVSHTVTDLSQKEYKNCTLEWNRQ